MAIPMRFSVLTAALLLLLLLPGRAHAQILTGYSYDADRVYTITRSSSWRKVASFHNTSRWYRSHTFEADERSCFSWSVSRSTLRLYGLGTTTSGCSDSLFRQTVRVAPGASKYLYRQRVASESQYLLRKIAHYSDGSSRVVSSSYAYRDKEWENHRVR